MRLIIIQISDMHCTASASRYTKKIKQAALAIKSIGKFDKAVFVFSGDLVNTASLNEFKAAKSVINAFLKNLSEQLGCASIPVIIVPGNHDIVISDDARKIHDIIGWQKAKKMDAHLFEEMGHLENFFKYAKSNNRYFTCDTRNPLYVSKILPFEDVKIQFCILNSAPFSTREPDDKQVHYFPSYVEDSLSRSDEATLKITVMHHHFEWFEWDTKEMLKRLIASDDFTFFGHDHKAEELSTQYADGKKYDIIMGGEFNLDVRRDSAFNAVTYDSETSLIERFEFNWGINEGVFKPENRGYITKKSNKLIPSRDFIDKLLSDSAKVDGCIENTEDYFVFPKLTAEGGAFPKNDNIYSGVIQEQDIFNALKSDKAIRITGSVGSGKTTLINHLYAHSVDYGFIPLLIERGDYRDSKIDRMFKGLFEDQYGSQSYHVYSQAENNRKIVFIDDADDITSKTAFENLVNSILESGQLLIYTTTEKNQDLAEIVRARLTGKESSNLDIWPVYKETRDSIVQKIGKKCGKAPEEVDNMIALLDYAAQCHPSIFSLTPAATLQYIRSFLGGEIRAKKDVQTISAVFENNIRTSIFSKMNHGTANIYLIVLDFLADRMYFNLKAENITLEQLASIIEEYNKKRRTKIDSIKFLDGCRSANLLKHCDGGRIGFYDNNTYAYFVAKAINREFENDPTNKEKLLTVMNYICFGINDTIILFLSFIRSNKNLIIEIANKALELLQDSPAWDIEGNNLPFLLQSADMPTTVPTEREKKEAHQSIEMVEKARHDSIQFRGIFDYNESDASKRGFVIAKAMKYTRLVGRALVDQYGFLEESDLDIILKALYNVPQKVIYSLLSPVQEHCDDIVKGIVDFFEETYPGQSISEANVREALGVAGTGFFLDVLNDIAFNSANGSTIIALRDGPITNTNHKLLRFMMEENADSSDEFVKKAVEFRQECEGKPYLNMLISQIVRKHIIFHSSIKHTLIDKLISGKVLSNKSRTSILLAKQLGKKG